jgi:putative SOS response-associated peptidase YedK
MCGRFTLTVDPAEAQEALREVTFPQKFAPRFNIAPTQPVLAIPNDDQNRADFFVWGLIPMWAKDPSIGNRLINARAETLEEKPAFRGGLKYKRCLILADGFYEWKGAPGKKVKTPFFIHMKDRKPFAFAGLWDSWTSPDGSQVKSCTMILHPRDYAKWLDPSPQTPDQLKPLLKPFPADMMDAYPVGTLVNTPANDMPELVVPAK